MSRVEMARRLQDVAETTDVNLVYLVREALGRLADAEQAKSKWFHGRKEELHFDHGRTPTAASEHRWATRVQAKALASDNQWQMNQSTMYAVNALMLQTEVIIEQNVAIITILEEIRRGTCAGRAPAG